MWLCTDEESLKLPYWLLNLHETIGLLIGKTEFVATSQANIVKTALLLARRDAAQTLEMEQTAINVDSPIPYKIERFLFHVENSTNKPPQASKQDPWNSIVSKLDVLRNDSRLSFMMEEWDGEK